MDRTEFQKKRERRASQEALQRISEREESWRPINRHEGRVFLQQTVQPLATAIEEDRLIPLTSTARLSPFAMPMLSLTALALAVVTLRTVYTQIMLAGEDEPPSYADLSARLAQRCYEEWKRRHVTLIQTGKRDPHLPNLARLLMQRCGGQRKRRKWVKETIDKFVALKWPSSSWLSLGIRLLGLAEAEGVIDIISYQHGKNEYIYRIHLAQRFMPTTAQQERDAALAFVGASAPAPMIVQPRPWTGLYGGGVLLAEEVATHDTEVGQLVRHHGHRKQKQALEQAAQEGTLSRVYEAVNALQGSRWALNEPVWQVLQYVYSTQRWLLLPGLPDETELAALDDSLQSLDQERRRLRGLSRAFARSRSGLRRSLYDRGLRLQEHNGTHVNCDDCREVAASDQRRDALQAEWEQYRQRRTPRMGEIRRRATLRSHQHKVALLRAVCQQLEDDAETLGIVVGNLPLFFPYFLDFRGRAYAAVAALSPQGDDLARGLLQFAQGKPLGERGRFWLSVHLANTYGEEKGSFAKREGWTEKHNAQIHALAQLVRSDGELDVNLLETLGNDSPLRSFWQGAKDPWQFLAACFEWARQDEPGFVTCLPIALDASASSLQHLSALAYDRRGAEVTNLVLSGDAANGPQDIYQRVANRVIEKINVAAVKQNEQARVWCGRVSRNVVKPAVMTAPYSATHYSRTKTIVKLIDEMPPSERAAFPEKPWGAASYLADIIMQSLTNEVRLALRVMGWLQEIAEVLAKYNRGVSWVTEVGFPIVVEQYKEPTSTRMKVPNPWGGITELRFRTTAEGSREIDRDEQISSIAPNVVHSLDAAHMMLTVGRLHREGLQDFAVIHDSYGVHAPDTDRLLRVLKEEFVRIYENPVLEILINRQILLTQDTPAVVGQMEVLKRKRPYSGDFDIHDVIQAEYPFA